MIGNFYELGPWRVTRMNANTENIVLEPNPGSWNRIFGLLFLDNPIGTGFSIASTPEELPRDQEAVARHLFIAISVQKKFAFESPNSEKKIKRRIMQDISHKWKYWKCELKKISYDPSLTIDEIIASQTDKRVDTFPFKNLVTSWFTEDKHLIN